MFRPLGMGPLPFPVLAIFPVSSYRCYDYSVLDNKTKPVGFLNVVVYHSPCISLRLGQTCRIIAVLEITPALYATLLHSVVHASCHEVSQCLTWICAYGNTAHASCILHPIVTLSFLPNHS